MALTITKSKSTAATKTASKPASKTLESKVDRIVTLDANIVAVKAEYDAKLKPLADERKVLADEIMDSDAVAKLDKLEGMTINGKIAVGEVSKKFRERTLKYGGKERLFELIGKDRFIELATFALGDLDTYLTEKERAEVLIDDHTGRRALKIKAKA